jgi:XTP/dITP diphosphohydrolase
MNTIKTLLIATHNQAKLEEIRAILGDTPFRLISLADIGISYDVEETGLTYHENAQLKAQAYCQLSGLPTIADDSGLEIAALNGEPGIYSARYAGPTATPEQQVAYVLDKMRTVSADQRSARFMSVLAYCEPSNTTPTFFEGFIDGTIINEPRGTIKKGVPYCSIFYWPEVNKTLAELKDEGVRVYSPARERAFLEFKRFKLAQTV